jgi:hypothetical protein
MNKKKWLAAAAAKKFLSQPNQIAPAQWQSIKIKVA